MIFGLDKLKTYCNSIHLSKTKMHSAFNGTCTQFKNFSGINIGVKEQLYD